MCDALINQGLHDLFCPLVGKDVFQLSCEAITILTSNLGSVKENKNRVYLNHLLRHDEQSKSVVLQDGRYDREKVVLPL